MNDRKPDGPTKGNQQGNTGRDPAKDPANRRLRSSAAIPNAVTAVGIGASAGGLDAIRTLITGLPASTGMAFIVVQHLDPTHESMMVDLLSGHTALTVRQAADGMAIEADCIYVIPPAVYLSVSNGALRLSSPKPRHGARLPFDFLLLSIAENFGGRAIGVVLSGTGSDGSLGVKAVKAKGGFVIAQDPDEAAFDGMPRNAILTGAVDQVLAAARIPAALLARRLQHVVTLPAGIAPASPVDSAFPAEIIELLRTKTTHDFTHYKEGTLQRRLERRMTMLSISPSDIERYTALLRDDEAELAILASELLINVTSFFRDAKVFDLIASDIAPELIEAAGADEALRIWVPGCSTGEEAYSLAMTFRDKIEASAKAIKLQIFASDVDRDAVERARNGLYAGSIADTVPPAQLARYFTKEDAGYRVSSELRSLVIFTVQDVLADPPFSRLDMISCRNLMIYLRPEAQTRVISLFDFALRKGGVLVLGPSETFDKSDGRFELVSKPARIYRKIGRGKPPAFSFSSHLSDLSRGPVPVGSATLPEKKLAFADLCEQVLHENYLPAAVLINRRFECLFFVGTIAQHLRVATGQPTTDLLSMVSPDLRTKLRAIVHRACESGARVTRSGVRPRGRDSASSYRIEAHPVTQDQHELILICFVDESHVQPARASEATPDDAARVAELEGEIDATRTELLGAIRNLEIAGDEQKAINEEALSVNEEYQSTNEELLTSKEELQSLNEELTALNAQLHESLDIQRTTSNDLQNVLYSTDVAMLFLDADLNIRFFTPATRLLFNVLAGDVGRPLADLSSLTSDPDLFPDAQAVLEQHESISREILTKNGKSYVRRVLPYKLHDSGIKRIAGVVITYTDITERKQIADQLAEAKREADLASIAKTRFLAAASHDLRQPLQTLSLLLGLIEKEPSTAAAADLLARFGKSLGGMSNMLNTLLDLNHIESGVIQPEIRDVDIGGVLKSLKDEFDVQARALGLTLRVVPSTVMIRTDVLLLEQMLRNLVSNALKYTQSGAVLLGCRRRNGKLRIEVVDTGVGIEKEDLRTIFDEHVQIDNPVIGRGPGLGLGLAIVKRVGTMLNHKIGVRSAPGKGTVFSIEADLADVPSRRDAPPKGVNVEPAPPAARASGAILVIEDDPEVSELLDLTLTTEGYIVLTAPHGEAAFSKVVKAAIMPELIVADFNLGRGDTGLKAAIMLQEKLNTQIPVIVLTGDITPSTLREINAQKCVHLSKPVNAAKLASVIGRLLPPPPQDAAAPAQRASIAPSQQTIYIVDDEAEVRDAIGRLLTSAGFRVMAFATCEDFLRGYEPETKACLLLDAYLPGMNGFDLLKILRDTGIPIPAIMITGDHDVEVAVKVIKEGAADYLAKPVTSSALLGSVETAMSMSMEGHAIAARKADAAKRLAGLSARQREVMARVLAGEPSKNIAADLGISQRTVENHRAAIMRKTGSASLPALARLAVNAG